MKHFKDRIIINKARNVFLFNFITSSLQTNNIDTPYFNIDKNRY